MSYLPTILVQDFSKKYNSIQLIKDKLACKWPHGLPPAFTDESLDADVALIYSNGYKQLLSALPLILDLNSKGVMTVICCDDYGDLYDLIHEIEIVKLSYDAEISVITGVLFGSIQRNEQVSKLRSQIGLIKSMHSSTQEELEFFQEELQNAAIIQKEFMSTEIKDVHTMSFSSLWQPASIVSGDMYDITQLDEDHVGIFIADAIGHGITAAMLAMMLTRTLAANRFDERTGVFTQPSKLLTHLNNALLERTGESSRFATAAYAILNCKTMKLTYAGAGHPPALLSKFCQNPELLHSEGPLLGVFEHEHFPQRSIKISSGDTLLMYSDGFEFALGDNNHKDGEVPTYLQSMHEFCSANSKNVLKNIAKYLNSTKSAQPDDDLTMICMQAKAIGMDIRLAA